MDVPEFKGDNPFFLMKVYTVWVEGLGTKPETFTTFPQIIDLDEPGWLAVHGHIFREEGELYLVRKDRQEIVFSVRLWPGEQGYYVARHIGNVMAGVETIAYGIGKKRVDGNEDNLWVLPWGQICVGKDVEYFALKGLREGRR